MNESILKKANVFKKRVEWINSTILLLTFTLLLGSFFFDPSRNYLELVTLLTGLSVSLLAILNIILTPSILRTIIPVVIIAIGVLISGLFIENFQSIYMYRVLTTLFAISIFVHLAIANKARVIFKYISLLTLGYLFTISFGYYVSFLDANSIVADPDAFTNPNTMGLMTLIIYIIVNKLTQKSNRILKFILLIVAVVSLVNFESRTTLLCLALYILIPVLLTRLKSFKRYSRFVLITTITVIAFLFPVIYVQSAINSSANSELLGKPLYSGRQELWHDVMYEITTDNVVLSGSISQDLIANSPSGGLHNMYVDMVYRAGLIFAMVVFLVLILIFVRTKNLSNKTFAAACCILVYGYTEAVFFGGTYLGMVMPFVFLKLESPDE
ncbi:MAG: hypothetical protein WAQ27_05570 [Candidatus Microsaccharimonas sp.]